VIRLASALLLIASAGAAAQDVSDSTYTSSALRAMVAAVAAGNHEPPASLRGYRSHIETETSLIVRDTLGREHSAEVEQFATQADWERSGPYTLHVVGYRAQSVGMPYSTLNIVRAWTVPSLYGERLSLGAYFARARGDDSLVAVHPFAVDRDAYYAFSGGDTVAVLRVGGRRIPIARIRVRPRFRGRTKLAAFDGEIDVDADRMQIVRMRGQFVISDDRNNRLGLLAKVAGVVAVAYIEFVNAEVAGKYWLPAFQRTEFQASIALLGQTRPIFRLVSTITDVAVVADTGVIANDSTQHPDVVIDWAPSDSVNKFSAWYREIGEQSASVHADDFADLAPPAWRSDGPPRFNPFPNSVTRVFRFNRVEGLFLGVAPSVEFRSLAPGLSAGVYGGWAFSEQTARGGAYVTQNRGGHIVSVRAERSLASTNDFELPLSDDPGFGALIGSLDDNDYVDRRTADVSLTRILGSVETGLATLTLGAGDDRSERERLAHGPLPPASAFLPNRGSLDGSYTEARGELELHPSVTGDYVRPGVGAKFSVDAAQGTLSWQRVEASLSARRYWGPVSVAAHADGGMVFGSPLPPQQLFEIGGGETLVGYDFKQFAGDRAALFRSYGSYQLNLWRRPLRVWRNFLIPGLSPGLDVSAQGGWTETSSPTAALAVRELGLRADGTPISTPTNGVRATIGAGVTFVSDLVHIGLARPVDRAARWRLVIGFGAIF
jgi:hypothetical protein